MFMYFKPHHWKCVRFLAGKRCMFPHQELNQALLDQVRLGTAWISFSFMRQSQVFPKHMPTSHSDFLGVYPHLCAKQLETPEQNIFLGAQQPPAPAPINLLLVLRAGRKPLRRLLPSITLTRALSNTNPCLRTFTAPVKTGLTSLPWDRLPGLWTSWMFWCEILTK